MAIFHCYVRSPEGNGRVHSHGATSIAGWFIEKCVCFMEDPKLTWMMNRGAPYFGKPPLKGFLYRKGRSQSPRFSVPTLLGKMLRLRNSCL